MNEEILWKGSPSQVLNLGKHLLALGVLSCIFFGAYYFMLLLCLVPLPVVWMFWNYLVIRCRVYELTSQRLRLYEGVFNQKIDELELYRVKDTTMHRPFWLRLFSLSSLNLNTSDRSHPNLTIEAVRDGVNLRETLRRQVECWRDRKRVREVDFEEGGDLEGGELLD